MEREFDYEEVDIRSIDLNPNLVFICDGDHKKVKVEQDGWKNVPSKHQTSRWK